MGLEIFKQGVASVRRSPFRSLLTMLGIVWGMIAVTFLIA